MMQLCNVNDLSDFVSNFLGYGDLSARLWFIGLEEGGSGEACNITARVHAWKNLGASTTVDLFELHKRLDETCYFEEKRKLQKTWDKLIIAQIAANDATRPVAQSARRRFQAEAWGRTGSETCLLELRPLSQKSTRNWTLADTWSLPYLASRKAYHAEMDKIRFPLLRKLIKSHRPRAVVFYGTGDRSAFENIAEAPFAFNKGIGFTENGQTQFFMMPHPVARGTTNAFWESLGNRLAKSLTRA